MLKVAQILESGQVKCYNLAALGPQIPSNSLRVNLKAVYYKASPFCNDPAGRYLGRGGPTNPPQKEQCGKTVHTV